MVRLHHVAATLASGLLLVHFAVADTNQSDRSKDTTAEVRRPTALSDARARKPADQNTETRRDVRPASEVEQGVLTMVKNHLPEVEVLLNRLRGKEPAQYQAAIRSLAKSARRLQNAKKRGEESFELEVQIVKAESAANVLIAKLKVRDNDKDRQALKKAIDAVYQAELARQRYEFSLLQDRLEKMQRQVTSAQKRLDSKVSAHDEQVTKTYETYLRRAGRKPAR